jgi:hypothetical protein
VLLHVSLLPLPVRLLLPMLLLLPLPPPVLLRGLLLPLPVMLWRPMPTEVAMCWAFATAFRF